MLTPADLDALKDAFKTATAATRIESFNDEVAVGYHDAAKGVQWHIAHKHADGTTYVAVNLEGIKYGKLRPIERLIRREQSRPTLVDVIRAVEDPGSVTIEVRRDGWLGLRTRTPINESAIYTATAETISAKAWAAAMNEARECLGADGTRAQQTVTRTSKTASESLEVVPHINIAVPVWSGPIPEKPARNVAVAQAMRRLRAIYTATAERAGEY